MTNEETKQYIEARNRALKRVTDTERFAIECVEPFKTLFFHNAHDDILDAKVSSHLLALPETNDGFCRICGLLAIIQAKKGKAYAASWMKRGMAGALANLQRKYDRIDNIINLNSEDRTESLTSQLADMAVYAILMLQLRAQISPEEFERWLREVSAL